ncbi:TRAP transporter large permease subunit [Desulfobacula sp.]|uniref:TRAP transporter large permease n=1 Tax=Desulfobacula sp. TaxID=2593537 RepID=UPI00261FF0C5|nr:TRAP transporter large permease subunit [Desulfobacula sp.]
MENIIIGVLLISFFLSTTSIAISFVATATILFVLYMDVPMMYIVAGLFSKLDSFPLEAILFFILLGNIMRKGNSSMHLIGFIRLLVSKISGGLGIAGIIASAVFGAISGSATATVVAIMPIVLPEMIASGYKKEFSYGVLTTAGILGVIIPPSILMILYSVVANVSMGKLFLGGFIPGIMIAIGLSLYVMIVSKKNQYGVEEKQVNNGLGDIIKAGRKAIWALMLPFIILGGIYGGLFTPTEAAVVGSVYAFFVEMTIFKTIDFKSFKEILSTSGISTGALLFTLAGATVFCDYLTMKQIPQELSSFVVSNITSPIVFLICINLLFLFLGTFLDPLSAIIVVAPLLLPTVIALNIDPIFLGVILTINLGVGYVTPPLGANLFVASMILKESYAKIAVAVIPTLVIYVIILILLNIFPSIIMFLPNLLM